MTKKSNRGRGRPVGSKAIRTREELFQFKVFREELVAYDSAAHAAGLTRSAWARLVLNEAASGGAHPVRMVLNAKKNSK